jgi:hypothetical protein
MRFASVLSLLAGLLLAVAAKAQTTSGIISANETWSGTITLTGDVICTSGTLTIQPGTIVQFATSNNNVVYGSSTLIFLAVQGNGAFNFQGTAGSRITFTTAAPAPVPGSWGKIYIQNLANSANTVLRYCDIIYAQNGLNINETGTVTTAPVIDNCTISQTTASGIFGGAFSAPQISNCTIHHTGTGIFVNTAGTFSITNTVIYHVPTGIILAGGAAPVLNATIDHCTIYDVDMNLTTNPQWWTGYGVFPCNTAGTLTFTNNIVSTVSLYCLAAATGWTFTETNNCFYANIGLGSIQSTVVNGTDLETDPLFTDAAGGDFSLDSASPCLTAGSGGSTMGAPVGIHSIPATTARLAAAGLDVRATLNQLTVASKNAKAISLSISDLQGRQVWSGMGKQLTWNGAHNGVYLYTIKAGAAVFQNSVVIAR